MMSNADWGREIAKALVDIGRPATDFQVACQVSNNRGLGYRRVDQIFYDVRSWLDKFGEPTGAIKTEFHNGHTLYSIDVLQRLAIEAG